MGEALVLTVPWPPSVNTYWRHAPMPSSDQVFAVMAAAKKGPKAVWSELKRLVPRSMISSAGREYRERCARALLAQGAVCANLDGRLRVTLVVQPPDRRKKRDLDNLPKGILDSLTHAGVWGDDSQIDDLRIIRGTATKGGLVAVHIQTLPQEDAHHAEEQRQQRRA